MYIDQHHSSQADLLKFASAVAKVVEEYQYRHETFAVDLKFVAPYANRFTNGAYIHGVPVNAPRKSLIEYSPSLGTIPRSHMCVRNATSHAQFVYDWAPVNETIVFVLE